MCEASRIVLQDTVRNGTNLRSRIVPAIQAAATSFVRLAFLLQRHNRRAFRVGANMTVSSEHRTRDMAGERANRFFTNGKIFRQT